jgi:hypothetical protein
MTSEKVLGLAVRYGEHFSPPDGTIAVHREILQNEGYVWFGKMGAKIGGPRTAALREQIEAGIETPLILVRARVNGRTVHYCRISSFTRERPSKEESHCIPSYYRRREDVGVWFRLTSMDQVRPGWLNDATVCSSQRPLPQTLATSVASFFYVATPILGVSGYTD